MKVNLIQGDISYIGHWQYPRKSGINIGEILKKKEVSDINYGDFFGTDDMGEYQYTV